MATRTIASGGGNFNVAATYVENIAPVAGDVIVGLSTSGNLTISASTVLVGSLDFSNYLGTLTLNNSFNLGNGATVGTHSFSATMSFSTATAFSLTNCISITGTGGIQYIRTNGKTIPYIISNKGGGACTINLLDNLNCTSLGIGHGNATTTIQGTYSIFCNNFVRLAGGGGSFGTIVSTTSTLNIVGPVGTYTNNGGSDPAVLGNINFVIDVGATGTFSTSGVLGLQGTISHKYFWKSGILAGSKSLYLWGANAASNQPMRLDLAGAGTWSNIYYADTNSFTNKNLVLLSDLYFDNLSAISTQAPSSFNKQVLLVNGGSGALKGGRIESLPQVGTNTSGVVGSPTYSTPLIKLNPGPVHTLSEIRVQGWNTGIEYRPNQASATQVNRNALICSSTASVRATLNFTGGSDKPSYWIQYTDIDASGGNTIYNFGGSQSNSLNIGTVSFGGGSSTTAFTFVN